MSNASPTSEGTAALATVRSPSPSPPRRDAFIKAVDADGNASMVTVAALKNGGRNRWRGWMCAVGVHTIHIAPDGMVEGATCHVGGALGNVFGQFELKSEWTRCSVDLCYCSDDIQLPKVAPGAEPKILGAPVNEAASMDRLAGLANHTFLAASGEFRVTWNLGKRCNFNCSYCPPSVHDNHSPFVPEEKVLQGVEAICAKIPAERRMRFTFTGGEPTLHPAYMRIVQKVASRPKTLVVTNTNGTRHEEYLRELNELN